MTDYGYVIEALEELAKGAPKDVLETCNAAINVIEELEGEVSGLEEDNRSLQSELDSEPESRLDPSDAVRLHEAIMEGRKADARDILTELCPSIYLRSEKEHANLFGNRNG
jgi:hypothetical protein